VGTLKQVTLKQATLKEGTVPERVERNIIGQLFPEVRSKSLAGRVVILPKDIEGKVTPICIAFIRSART
jgi:hypothetical protein